MWGQFLPLGDICWRYFWLDGRGGGGYRHLVDRGLPRWCSGKEYACQWRRFGFDPWAGKIPWSRKWQPTPVLLPGKSHGQKSTVGYSPWDHKHWDTSEWLSAQWVEARGAAEYGTEHRTATPPPPTMTMQPSVGRSMSLSSCSQIQKSAFLPLSCWYACSMCGY